MFQYELKKIPVWIHLGVTSEERKTKQKILLDFVFRANGENGGVSDDISEVQDYFLIQQFLVNFPGENHYCLLEKLYLDLLKAFQKSFSDIEIVELVIEKKPFEAGSVLIRKSFK